MAHSYVDIGGFGDFTVVKSNPSGNIVRFTLTDLINQVTDIRYLRAILADAISQFVIAERADLDTNGDTAITDGADLDYPGNGYPNVDWNFGGKFGDLTLTEQSNITMTGDITVSIPYADIV